MSPRIILFLILGLDAAVLFYEVSTISITVNEANLLYHSHSFIHYITEFSLTLFGHNDYALRLPMVLFNLLSILLLYSVSKPYVKRDTDRLWLVFVYSLLPGVMSAALLVNSAGFIIFSLFLLLFLYQRNSRLLPLLLVLLVWVDGAYSMLYFALLVYAFNRDHKYYMALNAILLVVSYTLFSFDTMGRPSGHFLDTLGLYATIFSPVIFIFLVYVLYRKMVTKEQDITLYISGIVFVLSLLLSFRQTIHIEDFAPYMMLLLPLAAQTFFSSYRVRLREFRGRYRILLTLGFILLAMHFFLLLFNKALYLALDDPHRHFAYKTHIVKELASTLKTEGINCVSAQRENLQMRLRFYGIGECDAHVLYEVPSDIDADVTIRYFGKKVAAFNVTNSPI